MCSDEETPCESVNINSKCTVLYIYNIDGLLFMQIVYAYILANPDLQMTAINATSPLFHVAMASHI